MHSPSNDRTNQVDLNDLKMKLRRALPSGNQSLFCERGKPDWLTLVPIAQVQRSRVPVSPEHALVTQAVFEGWEKRLPAIWWGTSLTTSPSCWPVARTRRLSSKISTEGISPLCSCALYFMVMCAWRAYWSVPVPISRARAANGFGLLGLARVRRREAVARSRNVRFRVLESTWLALSDPRGGRGNPGLYRLDR
jgi:hypothetical protein